MLPISSKYKALSKGRGCYVVEHEGRSRRSIMYRCASPLRETLQTLFTLAMQMHTLLDIRYLLKLREDCLLDNRRRQVESIKSLAHKKPHVTPTLSSTLASVSHAGPGSRCTRHVLGRPTFLEVTLLRQGSVTNSLLHDR